LPFASRLSAGPASLSAAGQKTVENVIEVTQEIEEVLKHAVVSVGKFAIGYLL